MFVFCASAKDILSFSSIDRINRDRQGRLQGFQRPQVAGHIKEIQEYLASPDSVLPNSVVVAFTTGVEFDYGSVASGEIVIETSDGVVPGVVVDGQQRLTALSRLEEPDFEVFVTGLICEDDDELRQQFILINNTRPLPRSLIYELLPTVNGLPSSLSSRSKAASVVEKLNHTKSSSLRGQIKQQTAPDGVIQDTVMQRLVMNSLTDGELRHFKNDEDGEKDAAALISEFFAAVQTVFSEAWVGHSPRTSRLVHGAGIVAMGFVMEYLVATENAQKRDEFAQGLSPLVGKASWTEGFWNFGSNNVRPWNSLQVVAHDWLELSEFLIRILRREQRERLQT